MNPGNTLSRQPGARAGSLFSPFALIFSTVIFLIVINVLILAGGALLQLWQPPPRSELVSAAAPDHKSPTPTWRAERDLPRPTRTLPATATLAATSSPTASPSPSPTPTPSPTAPPPAAPALPEQASIQGITGHPQSMPLSCESRSAVDWAAYFGQAIDEYTFFKGIPTHANPEKGFVGSVYGSWGQIPPASYGVHAKPVAQRLREFGLNAKAVRGMTWEELKAELAAGKPVIVWVVGHVGQGTPLSYTAPGGAVVTVAAFEHTVIAIGYTEDKITVLDGARVYSRHKGEFLKSWDVLGNQAVIWID